MPHRFNFSSIASLALLALLLLLFFAFQHATTPSEDEISVPTSTTGSWEVYFSDPNGPKAQELRGGPDAPLVEALDSAQYSIHMAMYHLDLWSVRDALIGAHRRGVVVQVVTESDNLDEPEIHSLESAGIEVLGDQRPGIMHHKFIVIDRQEVWTGSMNLTINGAYRNDNHLLRIRSREVAEDYWQEFQEMWEDDRFGALSLADTPYPRTNMDGIQVEVYFSPDDDVILRLLELIGGAEERIEFLAYAFTADTIGETLLDLHREGVKIRGVVEASQAMATGSETPALREAGLDVRLDSNPDHMHHKVFIIDGFSVILGSYNFTRSAEEKNDENVLILHDPALASQFLIEFERIYQAAAP
jgi:phosphatidylserine/phosphatidylglycerophosphate/cardiolipin synthase-like enzyme